MLNTPTPHICAAPGDFAKTVLMPGDPLRAKFIAETFLENPVLVNNVRGVQGHTGYYKGVKVSVMASGMGMPAIGIYSHELYNGYGVENIIRLACSLAFCKIPSASRRAWAISSLRDSTMVRDCLISAGRREITSSSRSSTLSRSKMHLSAARGMERASCTMSYKVPIISSVLLLLMINPPFNCKVSHGSPG